MDPGVGPDIAVCGSGEFPITIEGRFPNAVTFSWERAPLNDPTNFAPYGGIEPFVEVFDEGVYRLTGLDASGNQAEGSPDELVVVDVSDAILQVLPTVAEAGDTACAVSSELSGSEAIDREFRFARRPFHRRTQIRSPTLPDASGPALGHRTSRALLPRIR